MPLTFDQADKLFKDNKLNEISADPSGKRYLKLRSLNRKENLEGLFAAAEIEKPDAGSRALFKLAFQADIPIPTIEAFIRNIYQGERAERQGRETDLLNQLYRVQDFNWGGLHQNSLEKTIVDNYVKKITSYEALCASIENELLTSMRGYVICSWYNHWTSIIIEDIFKDHPNVLPAVGLIKKIDFFIRDVPFDLKVTYLPEEYLADKRQEAGLRPELTLLKQRARQNGLPIDGDLAKSALLQDLWAKVSDHPAPACKSLVAELTTFRNELVTRIEASPSELIQWLYEHQGERRFDASNRLFLVLVDQRNYFDSWKLKRAKALMEEKIGNYLDGCGAAPGRRINFTWEGEQYSTVSDVVVVRQTPVEAPVA
jgi:hypothetical protein